MNEPTLLPVKPGTLNAADKTALRKAGVIVIEHENPSELRLLKPSVEVSSTEMLRCAMNALCAGDSNYNRGTLQREQFAVQIAAVMKAAARAKANAGNQR